MDKLALQERWVALCVRLGAWEPLAQRQWGRLVRRYGEAWRFYHTLEHIAALLLDFDAVRHLFKEPGATEFALWLHDVVYDCYDPRVKDNEERSATEADHFIWKLFGHLEWHAAFSRKVGLLIMATKHDREPGDEDERLLADLDLAILGKPWEVFRIYDRQIADEYTPRPYPIEQYRAGRAAVLRSFLDRKHLYHTPRFRREYEAEARTNLLAAIAKLET